MIGLSYKDVGLKCGVEIHQQIDSHKLFCSCPSELRLDAPDIIVKRKIYAVAGETGKIDAAASYEQSRAREFVFEAYSDTTCEVELDESPPAYINKEALTIALQIALLFNAEPLATTQVMRKRVVNGSNTTGFQRTLMVARNGYVTVGDKKIKIDSVCLEEDSARIIKQDQKSATFRLDRLGVPLVEITTAPDIETPEEAKKTALKIGEVLRACQVKRGLGTIRQDVNLSITNGARTEIKGVQEPALISKTIEKEIVRQIFMLRKQEKIEATVRMAMPDGDSKFLRPLPGAERMYPETDIPLIKIEKSEIDEIKKNLPELKEDIISKLEELDLHPELIKVLISEDKVDLFNNLLTTTKANPSTIAKTITLIPSSIQAHKKISIDKLTDNVFSQVLSAVSQNKIPESSIEDVLISVCSGKDVNEVMSSFETLPLPQVEKIIKAIIEENKGAPFNALMGLSMGKLKGKAEGKVIAEIIKRLSG